MRDNCSTQHAAISSLSATLFTTIVYYVNETNAFACLSPYSRSVCDTTSTAGHTTLVRARPFLLGTFMTRDRSRSWDNGMTTTIEQVSDDGLSDEDSPIHPQSIRPNRRVFSLILPPTSRNVLEAERHPAVLHRILQLSLWWWLPRYHAVKLTSDLLVSLDLSFCDEAQFSSAGGLCFLEGVHLTDCGRLEAMVPPLVQAPRLLRLSLSTTKVTDSALDAVLRPLSNLRELDVSQCRLISSINAVASCPLLVWLSASNCLSLTNDGLLALRGLKSLRYLMINVCKLVTDLSPLEGATELRVLQCMCTKVTQQGIAALATLAKLTSVSFFSCDALSNVKALHSSLKLRQLSLSGSRVDDAGVADLPRGAISLRNLSLSRCTLLKSLSCVPHSVRKLDVSRMEIGNDALTALESMRELEEIDLSNCALISDLNSLAHCPLLRVVDVRDTSIRSAAAFALWDVPECGGLGIIGRCLKCVELEGCPVANRHEVVKLFNRLNRLSSLRW